MPGGDRTGPMGQGPRSGRGAGFCGGNNGPGFMSRMGQGMGGMGRGRGRRNWFNLTGLTGWQRQAMEMQPANTTQPDPQQELQILQQQAASMTSVLENLQTRISQLMGSKSEE